MGTVGARAESHRWEFRARFRKQAFGWKSQPAVQRVKEAVSEIKRVARRDPALAADGAVMFLERLSPALEHVDSSSGAIGTAVSHAIADLVPVIAAAPAEPMTRQGWLERLWVAHEADRIPYIERLGDFWGELCGSKEMASGWADRLVGATRMALSPDRNLRGHFHGTSACLSALCRAGRYEEIIDILRVDTIWAYKRWAVLALAAMGEKAEALRYAESCRGRWTDDADIDAIGEEILLSSGLADEAYRRYGLRANRKTTYLATFRAVVRKYPHKPPGEVLTDLVRTTPGDEGKWFAAAKDAGLYEEAIALAGCSPCDPKTLTRAARDLADTQPDFAVRAGLLALHWIIHDYGYDITSADVQAAYSSTMHAAEGQGSVAETRERVKQLVVDDTPGGFVASVLRKELGL